MNDTKLPPNDIAAEQAVLGAMMLTPDALATGLEMLTSRDFFRPAHQIVFETLRVMSDAAKPVDVMTVKAALERGKELSKVGGADGLHTLIASVPTAANCGYYAAKVRDLAVQRDVIGASGEIESIGWRPDLERAERIDAAQQALDKATKAVTYTGAISAADLINPAIEAIEANAAGEEQGLPTPWRDLNTILGGLRPGQLVTVGARPGIGKSIVMLNLATHLGIEKAEPVLFCTLEMSRHECMERVIAERAGVELSRIRMGALNDDDWLRVAKAHEAISAAGTLMINDDPGLSVQSIRSELRAMRRAGNPACLVVVDYLQLMTSRKRSENRQIEVSDFSRAFKVLAMEFGVTVVVGSQLNRGPEQRVDKRPLPADLRESGSIEQDSDIVILLYRDDYYNVESPQSGEIELNVAKNRQGPNGVITLAFRGRYASCDDIYRESGPWTPHSALQGDVA